MSMKTDLYTKIVLSIIAVCLVILVFKDNDVVTTAHALPSVAMTQSNSPIDVRIVGVSGYFELPVQIKSSQITIPMSIENVKSSIWNPLPVEIKK